MKKYRFKDLGLVILVFVLMITLLSCSNINKTKDINDEINRLDIETSLDAMVNNISEVSRNIQAEQDYFKNDASKLDYESFASSLNKSFEDLEVDFGKLDTIVIEGITELKLTFVKGNDLEQVLLIEEEHIRLNTLFQDLYKYHYMILETDIILNLFSDEVASLMDFMAEGNITSLEYNTELEAIMTKYDKLLVIDGEEVFNDEFLKDQSQIEDTLSSLDLAKEEILNVTTNSEIDEQVNEQIFNLFDYIQQSIQVVDRYTKSIKTEVYIAEVQLSINEGCEEYVKEILKY